jgi:MoaA/NifB/PqqE/SkfB family radical SAM enzyme
MLRKLLKELPQKHLAELLERPLLIPKVALNYMKLVALKQPVLRSVDLATTFDCQVNCAHCYCSSMRDPGRRPMTFEEICTTIDQCLRLGAVAINLAGGETLLDDRIYDIVAYIKPWRAVSVVTTNGLLLTEQAVTRLKRNGLYLVAVSIDEPTREKHDAFRGYQGLYERAWEGVRLARKAGLSVMINMMVSSEKLRDKTVEKMVTMSRAHGATLNLILPAYVGEQKRHGPAVFLDKESMSLLREYLSLPHVRWDGSSNYLREGCGAGVEKIAITPYGDVLACALIQASFGNVLEEPLEAIWGRMRRVKEFATVNEFCLASNDPRFIESYMTKIDREGSYPCPASKIFPDID